VSFTASRLRVAAAIAAAAGALSAGATAAAPSAQAAGLTKTTAQAAAEDVVKDACDRLDWCTAWGVESARTCTRQSARTVDCMYSLWDDNQKVRCDDVIRVVLQSNGGLDFRFPTEIDCHADDE
jgi:hypothetical protein